MTKPMPCGIPRYFVTGDINSKYAVHNYICELNLKDPKQRPYVFCEVEVIAPDYLEYPILQTRVKTKDGVRTVAPLGTWTGVYSSTEIYNAMDNFGYKFRIIRGYLFDTVIMFEEFVNYFNGIKSNTPKDNPRYYIAKLIMNSLYGKMGQDYKME